MARQKGPIRIEGTLGDLTFLRGSDIIKKKSATNKRKIKSDPAFNPFVRNGSDLAASSSAGKLIRDSIHGIHKEVKDKDDHWRMAGLIRHALNYDLINEKGNRHLADGEIGFLKDYEFNSYSYVANIALFPFSYIMDRQDGKLSINISSFKPELSILAPRAASHFQLVSAGMEIDFKQKRYVREIQYSSMYSLSVGEVEGFTLMNTVPAGSIHPLFLVFGIRFYNKVNEKFYPLFDKKFNALKIVDVSK